MNENEIENDIEQEVTSPLETKKNLVYIKVAIGVAILLGFVIYRIYVSFSNLEENTPQSVEKVTIFKNDDMVQTKFAGEITPELNAQKTDIYEMKKQNELLKREFEEYKKQQEAHRLEPKSEPTKGIDFKYTNKENLSFPAPSQTQTTNSAFDIPQKEEERSVKVENLQDSMVFDVKKNDVNSSKEVVKKAKKTITIAPGVVIKARLISGVRAPTLTKAVNEPQPVLLKVTDFAMLPNRGKLNIKDCVIKGEAKGNLSTETVEIRTNYLSCTTKDGEVLVSKLAGTVTGGNGSNGIAGVVVSKQGVLLGRSLIAGFVSGFANVANTQYQNTLTSTTGTLTTGSSNMSVGDMAKSGVYGGIAQVGTTMDKFYMDMVKQIEPSIEIKANINVDVVVTDESIIEFKGK